MKRILVLLCTIALSTFGCKAMSSLFAEQQWSRNYVLDKGVMANDPAIIDGNLDTLGHSVFPQEGVDTSLRFPMSEARIELAEGQQIRQIVIHSPNLINFEIHSRDNLGHWKKITEVKDSKKPKIEFKVNIRTDAIRIRVRRTSDDAAQRRKNTERVRGNMTLIHGQIRAPAKIYEIELYGFAAVESPRTSGDETPIF